MNEPILNLEAMRASKKINIGAEGWIAFRIHDFIAQSDCSKITKELDSVDKWQDEVMGGRKRMQNSHPSFHQNLEKLPHLKRLYGELNTEYFYTVILSLFGKSLTGNFVNYFERQSFLLGRVQNKLRRTLVRTQSTDISLQLDFSIATKGYHREPHLDSDSRRYIMLLYFSDSLSPLGGGELRLHRRELSNTGVSYPVVAEIVPTAGSVVIFESSSESWHSVSRVTDEVEARYFCYAGFSAV